MAPQGNLAEQTSSVPLDQDAPTEQEIAHINAMVEFMDRHGLHHATAVGTDGATFDIPAPISRVLQRLVPLMAQGAAISLIPSQRELTTQQAADLLNISRPSLIKLLDSNDIPFERSAGGHRRVRFADVMTYKRRRHDRRYAALAEIATIGQTYGAYDTDNEDLLLGIENDVSGDEHS